MPSPQKGWKVKTEVPPDAGDPLFTQLYGILPGVRLFLVGSPLPLIIGVFAKAVFMTPIVPEPCLTTVFARGQGFTADPEQYTSVAPLGAVRSPNELPIPLNTTRLKCS